MIPEDPFVKDIDPQLTGQSSQSDGLKTKSNLRLIPPPLFSRQGIPQNYKYALIYLFAPQNSDRTSMFIAIKLILHLCSQRSLMRRQVKRRNALSIA